MLGLIKIHVAQSSDAYQFNVIKLMAAALQGPHQANGRCRTAVYKNTVTGFNTFNRFCRSSIIDVCHG